MARYQRPDWVTKHLLNPIIALLVKLGVTPRGARILAVRGRKSGEWRTTPVNPLTLESGRYLVAPRGETQWVRNIRAAGGGELRAGSKREPIQVVELADDEKTEVLRAYLTHWKMEAASSSTASATTRPRKSYAGSRRTTPSSASSPTAASTLVFRPHFACASIDTLPLDPVASNTP